MSTTVGTTITTTQSGTTVTTTSSTVVTYNTVSIPTTSTETASTGYSPSVALTQYGFFFDQSRCSDCMACAIACKNYLGLTPGPQKALRMVNWETGTWPSVRLNFLFLTCFHCANPPCITEAVASGTPGLYKEPKYGAVLIDPNYATQLRSAAAACPYGAIAYATDDPTAPAAKCDMCVARLEQGRKPVCVMSCNMRALDFDTMANLNTKYGSVAVASNVLGYPEPSITTPSLVVKQADAKKSLIPYDTSQVLQLWANRAPLPAIYSNPTQVTTINPGVVGRSAPIIAPGNVKDVVTSTRSDDG